MRWIKERRGLHSTFGAKEEMDGDVADIAIFTPRYKARTLET